MSTLTTVFDSTHRAKVRRVGALLGVIALTASACTSESKGAPPAKDAQTAPSPIVFESARHGYELQLPENWDVTEYAGTWRSMAQFTPPGEIPGEDVASTPDGSGWLVANSMAIPAQMSSADWLAKIDRRVKSALADDCALSTESGVLAAEPATIGSSDCDGMTVVGTTVTHDDRGYYFTIGYPTGDSEAAAALESIVASIRFGDQ
jgi:hypothetical protein